MIVTKRPGPYLAIAGAIALLASAGSLPAGRVGAADAPGVVISEIHPGGSSSAYAADWFEVTNTGTTTVDITGWKFDDSSNDVHDSPRAPRRHQPGARRLRDLPRRPGRRDD